MDEKKKALRLEQLKTELEGIDISKLQPEEIEKVFGTMDRMSDEEFAFFLASIKEKWDYYKRTKLTYEDFLKEAIYYARQGYLVNRGEFSQEERDRLSDLADTNGLFRGYIV